MIYQINCISFRASCILKSRRFRSHNLFETSFAKIKQIFWYKIEFLKRNWHRKNRLYVNILQLWRFSLIVRSWSDTLPFLTLFVEITWEFSEAFDFGCILRSGCVKMIFRNKTKIFEGILLRFRGNKSVHQDLSFKLWSNYVCTIYFTKSYSSWSNASNLNPPKSELGALTFNRSSLSYTKNHYLRCN